MYQELKRIQEYEHPHSFRSKHEPAMHLRNSWKLERKPMPGGQTQDFSQESSRHQTGFFPAILPCWKLLRFQDISRCVSWHWSFPGFPVARCCHAQHQNPSPKNRLLRPSSTRPQVAAQPGTQYSRAKGGIGTTNNGGTKSGKTNAKQDNG